MATQFWCGFYHFLMWKLQFVRWVSPPFELWLKRIRCCCHHCSLTSATPARNPRWKQIIATQRNATHPRKHEKYNFEMWDNFDTYFMFVTWHIRVTIPNPNPKSVRARDHRFSVKLSISDKSHQALLIRVHAQFTLYAIIYTLRQLVYTPSDYVIFWACVDFKSRLRNFRNTLVFNSNEGCSPSLAHFISLLFLLCQRYL